MVESDKSEIIIETIEELLGRLGTTAAVRVSKDEEGNLKTDLSGKDLGILIGFHGETLSSLQLILNLLVHQKLGEWTRILLDVEGYRLEREARIAELARRTADRVRFLQTPVTLTPMPSFERRLVHLALSEDQTVETESIGEGWGRKVIVKPVK